MTEPHPSTMAAELQCTLNLLDELLRELRATDDTDGTLDRVHNLVEALGRRQDLARLPAMLLGAYNEVSEALGGIRLSRGALEAQALTHLRDSSNKISEVSSATESAALGLLDGLDHVMTMIDGIAMLVPGTAAERAPCNAALAAVQAEISVLFNHLQFQDITSQQLRGVAEKLGAVETRLESVASVLDHSTIASAPQLRPTVEGSFNPDASMRDITRRQGLADVAFQR
jgi:hypothetical protein